TAEELLHMSGDGFRYELVRGELRKISPTGQRHGRIANRIATSLSNHVWEHDLGDVFAAETGFKLSENPDTVRAPDVAFVCRERLEQVEDQEGFFPGAPDLAVEVISPGDTYSQVEEKVRDWLDAGARMVVVTDPRTRSVKVYRSCKDVRVLTEDDLLDGEDVVPGWKLPVKDIFAR
ncbi:MAG: Uma2 family endonuclease, partial [Calditrichaeota bacterium]